MMIQILKPIMNRSINMMIHERVLFTIRKSFKMFCDQKPVDLKEPFTIQTYLHSYSTYFRHKDTPLFVTYH